MNVPWLLVVSGLTLFVCAVNDPSVLLWLVIGSPLLLVLVPTAFPPIERRMNRRLDRAIEYRRQAREVRRSKPSNPSAGLSYPSEDSTGHLALSEDDTDGGPADPEPRSPDPSKRRS